MRPFNKASNFGNENNKTALTSVIGSIKKEAVYAPELLMAFLVDCWWTKFHEKKIKNGADLICELSR